MDWQWIGGLAVDWSRIDVRLADWHWIGGLAMDWLIDIGLAD